MIVDCFPFLNELDLLELRLNELWPYVDRFVLCEATLTHSNKPKPLFFEENKERFRKYFDKLDSIVLDSYHMIDVNDSWEMEKWQKQFCLNYAVEQLGVGDGDIIICTDLDEIPNGMKIFPWFTTPSWEIVALQMPVYYYWMNCVIPRKRWTMGKMIRLNNGEYPVYRKIRRTKQVDAVIKDGGWHFSYLGDIKYKIESFAHTEFDKPPYNQQSHIDARVSALQDIYDRGYTLKVLNNLDYLPKYVLQNLDGGIYGGYILWQ